MIQIDILNQGSIPGCAAFACAGLANAYLKQRGQTDFIDAIKLYEESRRRGMDGNKFEDLFADGVNTGWPLFSGKRIKVKNWQFIPPQISEIEKALDKYGGLVASYDLYDGDPFNDRFVNHRLVRRPNTQHGIVLVGYNDNARELKFANSWGSSWQDNGYGYIPYVLSGYDFLKQTFFFEI